HATAGHWHAQPLEFLLQPVERNGVGALGGDDVRDEACRVPALLLPVDWPVRGDNPLAAPAGQRLPHLLTDDEARRLVVVERRRLALTERPELVRPPALRAAPSRLRHRV